MSDYEVKTAELLDAMRERHASEFREYQEELRRRFPLRPKFSRECLNLRRVQVC